MDDAPAPLKRSRARRAGAGIEPPSVKPRHGLLTPEASRLLESQTQSLRDRDLFPFLELPAEIRLHIYHMALVRHEPVLLHAERAPEKVGEEAADATPKVDQDGEQETPHEAVSAPSSTSSSPSTTHAATLGENVTPNPRTLHRRAFASRNASTSSSDTPTDTDGTPPTPTPSLDPIVPVLLRLNKQIYKEARQLLYSENVFTLSLSSGIHTLSTLHQRSRSLIKHIVLTIPSHHDILDGFADLVRLGLRYCWGLKSFRIILYASLPDDSRNGAGVGAASSVYANAFHILRWLPRGCSVVLEGTVSEQVRRVVSEEGRLMNSLDERSYLKRQHQMPERH